MIERWESLDSKKLLTTDILTVRTTRRRSPTLNVTGEFISVETPDWVNVIAVTSENEVVLIRQYRHGIDEIALEIPGGVIDPGESPGAAAARELREETGYAGDDPIQLGVTDVNPAIQTNRCYTYLIRNAEKGHRIDPEEFEEIEVRKTSFEKTQELIRSGEIAHSLVITAFYWYNLWDREGR